MEQARMRTEYTEEDEKQMVAAKVYTELWFDIKAIALQRRTTLEALMNEAWIELVRSAQ